MQAVLLATGETNKLAPLTETIPSPMVPIAGRPVLAYPLELLIRQGFKQIVVVLYSLANEIESYLGLGNRWGVELQYVLLSQPMGSAGALRLARQHLTEPFVVIPADQLIDVELLPILEKHIENKSAATIAVHPGINPRFSGYNLAGENLTRPSQDVWFETGVYVFDPSILHCIPAHKPYDICADLIPALTSAGMAVNNHKVYGYWNALETFSDYQNAQNAFLASAQGKAIGTPSIHYTSMSGRRMGEGIWIGRNCDIHPEANLIPPVYIGENCSVSRGAEVGPSTVLGNHIMVDEEATVANSTILDGTYIGKLVNVDNRLVNKGLMIDLASGEKVYITDEHLLSKTYRAFEESSLSRVVEFTAALMFLLCTLPFSIFPALLLLLTTGRLISQGTYVHRLPREPGDPQAQRKQVYQLPEFQTRNAKGQYNWLGKFLISSDMYRLPHLWNVLKGDLRLVGVKPLTPEEDEKVREAWQEKRYELPPAFTGLWYVQVNPGSALDDYLVADAYYTATRSWQGDLKLLFRTFLIWFRRLLT